MRPNGRADDLYADCPWPTSRRPFRAMSVRARVSKHAPCGSAVDRVDLPRIRDALQRMRSTVPKRDPRTGDQVFHGSGDEDFARLGQRRDAGADVDADTPDIPGSELYLPGVNAGADLHVEAGDSVPDYPGRFDAGRRSVEGGQQAVPSGLDEPPTP